MFKVLHIKDEYVVGESGKINYEVIFRQFYKKGYEDWFVGMETKMTPEQLAENLNINSRVFLPVDIIINTYMAN